MDISFQSNLREWAAAMTAFQQKQLPFATAKALTETARDDIKPAIEQRLNLAFDRPTPFTQRGVAYRPASKQGLVATVLIKDIQAAYLQMQETGGTRLPKRRALVMPAGRKVNQYGNLPRGAVKAALARPDVFSGVVRGVAGIWQRRKTGLTLLIRYEDRAEYRPRFAFQETARAEALRAFPRRFEAAFNLALRSAR